MECPVCDNDTLVEGERVDVGWVEANGIKSGPDSCEFCGYVEQGPNDPVIPSLFHFRTCWTYQLDPFPPIPEVKKGVFDDKYLPFFLETEAAYGKCSRQCLVLAKQFPELKIVYGAYLDVLWGARGHFWCTCDTIIVDPTASQFPSRGSGLYTARCYVALDTLKRLLNPISNI